MLFLGHYTTVHYLYKPINLNFKLSFFRTFCMDSSTMSSFNSKSIWRLMWSTRSCSSSKKNSCALSVMCNNHLSLYWHDLVTLRVCGYACFFFYNSACFFFITVYGVIMLVFKRSNISISFFSFSLVFIASEFLISKIYNPL